MARRRDLFCRSTALAVPLIMLGVILLAGAVFISNHVVEDRLRVAALEDRQEFLEARAAGLQSRWNALTTAATIQSRAQAELGLIMPSRPHLVLVQATPQQVEKSGVWGRFLAHFGGATPLEAAVDPLTATGGRAMVSLEPFSSLDGAP